MPFLADAMKAAQPPPPLAPLRYQPVRVSGTRRAFLVKVRDKDTPKRAQGTTVVRDEKGGIVIYDEARGTRYSFANVEQFWEDDATETTEEKK
jgi:hypothetical protein